MGEHLQISMENGQTTRAYLATPAAGTGPGVLVIQEWWGLIDQIRSVCDRFADAGWVALAPDLYGGTEVPLNEPDEAAKQMMALRFPEAAKELANAVDVLAQRSTGNGIGVIGFCMGGGLALVVADARPDLVRAVVPCYGVLPWKEAHPTYEALDAAVLIQCAELDSSFPPSAAQALAEQLQALGKQVELRVLDGVDHAFFNEDRPEVYSAEAAARLWTTSLEFLEAHVGAPDLR